MRVGGSADGYALVEPYFLPETSPTLNGGGRGKRDFYFEEIRVFKAGFCMYVLAWDNEIGLWCYFVGFEHRSND